MVYSRTRIVILDCDLLDCLTIENSGMLFVIMHNPDMATQISFTKGFVNAKLTRVYRSMLCVLMVIQISVVSCSKCANVALKIFRVVNSDVLLELVKMDSCEVTKFASLHDRRMILFPVYS